MNLLDVVIVLAAVAYGIGGFRSGALVGAFSLVGFFGGAAIGAQVARPLGAKLADGRAQIPIAIVCVLLLATAGQLLGVFVAGRLRERFVRARGRPWDSALGAVLGVVAVLLVAWMVALPLATSAYPKLAAEASQSTIVRGVNQVVPDPVRGLYASLRNFFNQSGFPPVLGDLPSTSVVAVAPPPADLPRRVRRTVADARSSIVKIYGQAPECGRGIEGSGFVYARNRVLTNAHVVAGTRSVEVVVGRNDNDRVTARVVLFDPDRDVAVLAVPGLDAQPLDFAPRAAAQGTPAVVVGYPQDGPYTVRSARVRSQTTVRGSNIYGNGEVRREIYSVRAVVRSGNSGGPMLGYDGRVLGMVFATALDSKDTGFVLTKDEIDGDADAGRRRTTAVGTGGCTPD
ncbi:Colicin V production protein [Jatrophihabitans endophyticus]|uniref:Colicin V production protein n=1 Tax=Jatrophihabitans endophyticus TaxID=1206085 RepID=A0A1M5H3D4_9ACTN|nr:MarP family serine protease [Jatrophihabitans endophyticus]SHG10403.1 Colicin V production protein [Jatrophihabitans endophyticus]